MAKTENSLDLDSVKQNLKNTQVEVEFFEKQIPDVEEQFEKLKEMRETKKAMHLCAMKAFEPVSPQWKFQEDPEFNAHRKHLSDLEHYFEMKKMDQELVQTEDRLNRLKEQQASVKESAEKLRQQVAELEASQ